MRGMGRAAVLKWVILVRSTVALLLALFITSKISKAVLLTVNISLIHLASKPGILCCRASYSFLLPELPGCNRRDAAISCRQKASNTNQQHLQVVQVSGPVAHRFCPLRANWSCRSRGTVPSWTTLDHAVRSPAGFALARRKTLTI